jgi:hypothetical protein
MAARNDVLFLAYLVAMPRPAFKVEKGVFHQRADFIEILICDEHNLG